MIMLLITHISVALLSIAVASLGIFRPSHKLLHISYGLIGATLVSGTALVILSGSPVLSSCLSGLVYSVIVTALCATAHRKLAMNHE